MEDFFKKVAEYTTLTKESESAWLKILGKCVIVREYCDKEYGRQPPLVFPRQGEGLD